MAGGFHRDMCYAPRRQHRQIGVQFDRVGRGQRAIAIDAGRNQPDCAQRRRLPSLVLVHIWRANCAVDVLPLVPVIAAMCCRLAAIKRGGHQRKGAAWLGAFDHRHGAAGIRRARWRQDRGGTLTQRGRNIIARPSDFVPGKAANK